MTTYKDLLLSLLSMDAYNRGYGSGISDGINLDNSGNDIDGLGQTIGLTIGNSNILFNLLAASINPESITAGYYALAYDTPYGIVISNRGTDGDFTTEFLNTDIPIFLLGDYSVYPVGLASQFAQAVSLATNGASLTMTGHSLGGALAGSDSARLPQQTRL